MAAALLCACEKQTQAPAARPPEVGVVTVQPQSVALVDELPGRTGAYLVAQVRARVDGIVVSREFTEGSEVKAGQRLYKIDPAPYIAALNSAKAMFAKAQANLATQNALVARYKVLVAANAVSRQDYDNAVASAGQAAADVASGKAAVDMARINLGYTDVLSPVTGRIGISQVTPGAYVQASAATLLSTVQQLDPMYVDLTQSSLDGLRLHEAIQGGGLTAAGAAAARVALVLEDGKTYPRAGKLQFTDVTVDQTTGSVTVRAIFANPDGVLLPGMFVRARIEEGVDDHVFLVPQPGVLHDPKGQATALVVGPDNKVSLRVLATKGMRGTNWIVAGGLKPGDRVIVDGTMKLQPGARVRPVAVQPAPDDQPDDAQTAYAAADAARA